MKIIRDLISKLAGIRRDLADLEKLKTKAEADLKAATAPELSIQTARKLISDARLTLDLVDARIDRIEPSYRDAADELAQAIRAAARKWNTSVAAGQNALKSSLVQSTLPYFNKDERACLQWWESGNFIQMPIFAQYRDAFYDEESLRFSPQRPAELMAKHFLRWVESHAENVGVKASDIEALS